MTIYVGETGRTIRLNAGLELAAYSDLKIIFVMPDKTTVEKSTADGVTLGAANITDPTLGPLLAGQYIEYEAEPDLFTAAGRWAMYIKYENHNISPAENLYGEPVKFRVKARAETAGAGCP